MVQVVLCPGCGGRLALPADEPAEGRHAQCPGCEAAFELSGDALESLPAAHLLPVAMPSDDETAAAPDADEIPLLVDDQDADATLPEPTGEATVDLSAVDGMEEGGIEVDGVEVGAAAPSPDVEDTVPAPYESDQPTLAELLDRRESHQDAIVQANNEPDAPEGLPPDEIPSPRYDFESPPAEAPTGVLEDDFDIDLDAPIATDPESTVEGSAAELVNAGRKRRGGRLVGRLVGAGAGVAAGVVIGYYLLLVLGGPSRDALNVAQFLPAAMLPDAFSKPRPAWPEPTAKPVAQPTAPLPTESQGGPSAIVDPEVERASFDSPAQEPAIPKVEPVSDPVPAEPVTPDPTPPAAELTGAPRFGFDQLTASLTVASEAAGLLAEHKLTEPDRVAEIGRAYAQLCELAQVVSRLEEDSSHPDLLLHRLEAEDLYRQVFRSAQTRGDARQIATRWIAWLGRPHGGVFFSGVPVRRATRPGSVHQYDFPLDNGQTVPVLSAKRLPLSRFRGADEIGVIGCVVDDPAERITGYTGDAQRVVWLGTSLSLGLPDLD